jgi:hypothetical protein
MLLWHPSMYNYFVACDRREACHVTMVTPWLLLEVEKDELFGHLVCMTIYNFCHLTFPPVKVVIFRYFRKQRSINQSLGSGWNRSMLNQKKKTQIWKLCRTLPICYCHQIPPPHNYLIQNGQPVPMLRSVITSAVVRILV